MRTLTTMAPAHFAALARLIMHKQGSEPGPFGRAVSDSRMVIRQTSDGNTIEVEQKSVASNVPEAVMLRHTLGEPFVLEEGYRTLALHLQSVAEEAIFSGIPRYQRGEAVAFRFSYFSDPADRSSIVSVVVEATNLSDATAELIRQVPNVESSIIAINGERLATYDLRPITNQTTRYVTETLRRTREKQMALDAARESDHVVVFISFRDGRDDPMKPPIQALPIEALSVEDALTTFRADRTRATIHFDTITVRTLYEFLSNPPSDPQYRTPIRSLGLMRREYVAAAGG